MAAVRREKAGSGHGGAALEAASLRAQADALEGELERLERHDWPGWLRYGAMITERISELKRQAAMLEQDARRIRD